jgi:hypothetical protein
VIRGEGRAGRLYSLTQWIPTHEKEATWISD